MGIVIHLMLMDLDFPQATMDFFSGLLEFVTFDLIPTEKMNKAIFGWENTPYSEKAKQIGYVSRYVFENSGSIPYYILLAFLLQLIYALIKAFSKSHGRIYAMATSKQKGFFWSGCNDQFNDAYLTLTFAVGINTSSLAFLSAAVAFNNCFAGVIALALIFSPLKLGHRLRKGWKRKATLPESSE